MTDFLPETLGEREPPHSANALDEALAFSFASQAAAAATDEEVAPDRVDAENGIEGLSPYRVSRRAHALVRDAAEEHGLSLVDSIRMQHAVKVLVRKPDFVDFLRSQGGNNNNE